VILGALRFACARKPLVVFAHRVVPARLHRNRAVRLAAPCHRFSPPHHARLPHRFGSGPLHAQVTLLLDSFRSDWSVSLIIFGIHLILLGYLIYRSRYIPQIIGVILVIDGLGWLTDSLQPYFYPSARLGFLFITFPGELVFMLRLLIRGRKIQQPRPAS
jgi:uncharacterized protein DUF4386